MVLLFNYFYVFADIQLIKGKIKIIQKHTHINLGKIKCKNRMATHKFANYHTCRNSGYALQILHQVLINANNNLIMENQGNIKNK